MHEAPKPVKYRLKHTFKFHQTACKNCGAINWSVCKLLNPAGHAMYPWYCLSCCQRTNIYEPKHEHLTFTAVFEDRGENECEYCGRIGAERHHIMPRHLVGEGESDKWPVFYLCQEHHMLWHNTVTPNMGCKD